MGPRERLLVHFVTKQSLRMQRRRHIQRLVIVVGALHRDEARRGVGADHLKKIRQTRPSESPNHIPSFDADVARVLPNTRQSLHLRQLVLARLLHRATDS